MIGGYSVEIHVAPSGAKQLIIDPSVVKLQFTKAAEVDEFVRLIRAARRQAWGGLAKEKTCSTP